MACVGKSLFTIPLTLYENLAKLQKARTLSSFHICVNLKCIKLSDLKVSDVSIKSVYYRVRKFVLLFSFP